MYLTFNTINTVYNLFVLSVQQGGLGRPPDYPSLRTWCYNLEFGLINQNNLGNLFSQQPEALALQLANVQFQQIIEPSSCLTLAGTNVWPTTTTVSTTASTTTTVSTTPHVIYTSIATPLGSGYIAGGDTINTPISLIWVINYSTGTCGLMNATLTIPRDTMGCASSYTDGYLAGGNTKHSRNN